MIALKSKKECGFSLVELAIVIVILGLITVGVLGAQSLIESAKRQKFINELSSIETGVRAFKLEYSEIPGDFDEAWEYWGSKCAINENACNGNGNKKYDNGEYFWQHLILADIIRGDHTPGNYQINLDGNEAFNWTISKPGSGLGHSIFGYPVGTTFFALQETTTAVIGTFTVKSMKRIDEKIDDGIASSGRVLALNHGGQCTTVSYIIAGRGETDYHMPNATKKYCRPYVPFLENEY
jgi:prepilin-type N-terminal cleavage/methylation domain-containing protein